MEWISDAFELLIPIVAIVATFTFVGVVVWTKHRRSERDAYYRHELVKQMAEKGTGEDQLLAFMREEAKVRQQSRRQGLIVGGVVTLAIGVGYMIGFQWIDDELWMIGAVPALVGVALLSCSLLLGRAERRSE